MITTEASASRMTERFSNPSARSVVVDGVVRGSHSAEVGIYQFDGGVVALHVKGYRHNASSAVLAIAGSEYWEVLSVSSGGHKNVETIYGKGKGDSAWVQITPGEQVLSESGKFVDGQFMEMLESGGGRPRGILMPEGIVELVNLESEVLVKGANSVPSEEAA